MQLITRKGRDYRDFNAYITSDWHFKNAFTHIKGAKQFVKDVKADPLARVLDVGDAIGGITAKDKKFCMYAGIRPLTPLEEMEEYLSVIKPIKSTFEVKGDGNHEGFVKDFGLVSRYMANEIGCDYGTYQYKFSIRDTKGKTRMSWLLWHIGATFGSRVLNQRDGVKRLESFLEKHLTHVGPDCCLRAVAHIHQLHVRPLHPELLVTGIDW